MQTRWAEWPIAQAVSWSGSGFIVYLSPENFLQTTIFSAHASGGSAHLNGGDVRAYDAATGAPIPFELQFNKTTQTARLWARFPSFDGSQVLRLEWGDADLAPLPVDDAYGRNAVWQDYSLVIHATEDGTTATDSTGNGAVTVEGGGLAPATVPHPGGLPAWKFDGVDDYLRTPSRDGLHGARPFTAQAWIAVTAAAGDDFIFNKRPTNATNIGWGFRRVSGSTTPLRYTTYGVADYNSTVSTAWGAAWRSVAFAVGYDNAGRYYRDGTQLGGDIALGLLPSVHDSDLTLGRFLSNVYSAYADANMTEWRIAKGALSGEWLATEYANQSDPLSFWGTPDTGSITPDGAQPSNIVMGAAVSAPAATASAAVSPTDMAMGTAVSLPDVSAEATAHPGSIALASFVSAPTATTGAAVTPDSIVAGVRVSSPSALVIAAASPDNVYMGAFVSAPTASESGEVLPANVALGIRVSPPVVTASASVVPGSVRLSATISAPPAGTTTSAQPGSVRVPVAVSSPWASTGALSTPDDIGLSVFVSSPVVDTSGVASPSHVIARVKASAPHVSAIWHAQPVNVRAAVAVNSPATSTSVTVPDASRLYRTCARPLVYRVACRGDRIHVAGPRQRIHKTGRP